MARGIFGGRGAILAAVIATGAFAGGGCFYPSYEVVTDGSAGSGGTGGSGSVPCEAVGSETPLACGQANPSAIAVNLDSIFWTNEDSRQVLRMPRTGGEPTVIALNEDRPCGIAANENFVVWRTRGGGVRLFDFEKPGIIFNPEDNLGDSCALSMDASFIYTFNVTDAAAPKLYRITISDGVPDVMFPVSPDPVGVVAAAGYIYWTEASTKQLHAGLAGNLAMHNTHPLMNPCGLAASDERVVATSFGPDKQVTVFVSGNPMASIFSPSPPCAVAVNATGIFWLGRSDGKVYSSGLAAMPPQPPQPPQLRATGPAPACAIAVQGANIYWTSCEKGSNAGRIMHFGK
jgi:hypothetical protein